jgi:hypothetical protein
MNPDDSDVPCVTSQSAIPDGFIVGPAWHRDEEHLLLQAENESSPHKRYSHLSWGIDTNLWLIRWDLTGRRIVVQVQRRRRRHRFSTAAGDLDDRIPRTQVVAPSDSPALRGTADAPSPNADARVAAPFVSRWAATRPRATGTPRRPHHRRDLLRLYRRSV